MVISRMHGVRREAKEKLGRLEADVEAILEDDREACGQYLDDDRLCSCCPCQKSI